VSWQRVAASEISPSQNDARLRTRSSATAKTMIVPVMIS
jgi:hypothetical protein